MNTEAMKGKWYKYARDFHVNSPRYQNRRAHLVCKELHTGDILSQSWIIQYYPRPSLHPDAWARLLVETPIEWPRLQLEVL